MRGRLGRGPLGRASSRRGARASSRRGARAGLSPSVRQPSGLAARGRPPPESSRRGARASSRRGARVGLSPSARGRLGRASSRRGARPRAGEVLFSVESSLVLCAPLGRTSPSGRFFRGRGPVCEGSDIRTQVYGINHQTVFYAPNIQ